MKITKQKIIEIVFYISLFLSVISCCIIGIFDLNPLWYIFSGVVGLGVLIPFVVIVVYCLVIVPFLKLKDKIKKK